MNAYRLIYSGKFKKDFKKIQNKPKAIEKVTEVFNQLLANGVLAIPNKMKPHLLIGNYKDHWECHILPDLLLIWEQDDFNKEITLVRLGSHSELFK